MKKLFCALGAILCLVSFALGESVTPSATSGVVQLITPTPSVAPSGTRFSQDGLTVTLPVGLEILDATQREAYDAAVQADYPDAARPLLAAVNADASAAVYFATVSLDSDAATAAREAAQAILSSTVTLSDVQYGENAYTRFICAIGEQIYSLYYLSGTAETLIVSVSGLEETEIESMLTGLHF